MSSQQTSAIKVTVVVIVALLAWVLWPRASNNEQSQYTYKDGRVYSVATGKEVSSMYVYFWEGDCDVTVNLGEYRDAEVVQKEREEVEAKREACLEKERQIHREWCDAQPPSSMSFAEYKSCQEAK